jgi:tight adherence protein B
MILLPSLCAGIAFTFLSYALGRFIIARWSTSSAAYGHWLVCECERALLVPPSGALIRRSLCVGTAVCAVAGAMLGDSTWQKGVFGIVGAAAGYSVPAIAIRIYDRHRLKRLDGQLAPALTLMASALQAGRTLPLAIEFVAREAPSPIADEFALVVKEIGLGQPLDQALARLARRLPSEDVWLFVDAVVTLRETGADLVSSFQVIARTIQERRKIEGRIRVLTSEGFYQGITMCMIPPVMLIAFSFIDPKGVSFMLSSPVGWLVLAVVLTLTATGFFFMHRIVAQVVP